jgi:hypothetical protein
MASRRSGYAGLSARRKQLTAEASADQSVFTQQSYGNNTTVSSVHTHRGGGDGVRPLRLSTVLRQHPGSFEGVKISVVEKYVTEIDQLHQRYQHVEVMFLSHNSVTTLQGFTQFKKLRVLSLAANVIQDIDEIQHLFHVPTLQILNLDSNPITALPNYRCV